MQLFNGQARAQRVKEWLANGRQRRKDAAFRIEGLLRNQRGMRIGCAFGLAMLLASAVDSYVGEPSQRALLLTIRLAGAASLVGIFVMLSARHGVRWSRPLALLFVISLSATMHALALHTGGQASPQYDRMNLVILGLAVFPTWSPLWATLACGLVLGVYVAGSAATAGIGGHLFELTLGRLLASSAVTITAAAVRERLRWQAFSSERVLEDSDARRRETEQRYQHLVEMAGSAILVLAPDHRIIEFNRQAETLYGRARSEVIGRDYATTLLPPERRADFARFVQSVLGGESVRGYETAVRSRDGAHRVVLWNVTRVGPANGEPVGIIAVGQDITERQRATAEVKRLNAELEERVQVRTAELRASEDRFRTMFESAPIGIMTVDREGHVRHSNRALQAMLGYDAAALRGMALDELVAPADRLRGRTAFTQLCDRPGAELLIDKRYVSREGATVWVHEASCVVQDQQGAFDYALTMVEDVTERQRAEERARRHQEQLAHVLRVNTMGEMAAELAHELNQPLGAIVNFANGTLVRLRANGAAPEMESAVGQIASEGLRAGEIIRRVRDFVRQSDARREPSDLNYLVRQAAHLIEADARGRGIPVRLALDPTLPTVEVDRIQVEQLIVNLLRNAIDAIVEGPHGEDEVLVRTSREPDGGLEVSVRDTGVGLPPDTVERIFDAFVTTKRGGLGMGLSISRSIVEAHGGRLWATNNVDGGTTFTFRLPQVHGRGVEAA